MRNNTEEPCSSCDELVDFFYEFTDGELDEHALQRMRAHVHECERCADLVDVEMHIRDLIRRCCAQQAPSSLRSRVITRIRTTHLRIERY
ncbi:MAG: mycothiol system anti-sigma-R factor [Actinomycetaceae bacterium]|nr:mycothiol system anti-sigma-R factor [Actinomycetaceae bacterium]